MNRWPVILFLLLFLLSSAFLGHAASARVNAPAQSRVLALAYDTQAGRETIGTVDVISGTIAPFGAGLPACCTNSVLDAALDAAGNRYFAIMARTGEADQRLLTFSTQTGAASASAALTSTLFANYLAYDTTSAQLLALLSTTSPSSLQVARLDPAAAAFTLLGSPIPDCCSPKAFDAAYDDESRKLYAVVQPNSGEPQPRLLTFSGADGSVLADVPITSTLEIDHLAYDAAGDTLWALVYDAGTNAERLAVIDTASAAVTPIGAGAANCCNRLVTDVAIDTANNVLIAPMIDTSPAGDPVPAFFRFSLTTGEVLGSAPIDPAYTLHYIAFEPAPAVPPTSTPSTPPSTPTATRTPIQTPAPTPATKLYLPLVQREHGT